jgi:hypothetical protein
MRKDEIKYLIHDFPDRSIRWLLETPDNLRGLLLIAVNELASRIDYDQIERIERTFVLENFRKREADMIFKAPFLDISKKPAHEVIIYILIEHQSSIDYMMPFRILSYMVQIWDMQRKQWEDEKIPQSECKFCPILPVIFYTGEQRWNKPLEMKGLVNLPTSLERYIPHYEIAFLNLKATSPDKLVEDNHPFGWVLNIMQKENANINEFTEALNYAIKHLDQMPLEEQANWSKLLYFLYMFIHDRREISERSMLLDIVEKGVTGKFRLEEVKKMGKTIAQSLMDEGFEKGFEKGVEKGMEKNIEEGIGKGMQQFLVDALEIKFKSIPSNMAEFINNITNKENLRSLHRYAMNCNSIDEFDEKLKALKNDESSRSKNSTNRRK